MGTVCQVLVEGFQDGRYVGRSSLEAPEVDGVVAFTARQKLTPGQYVSVRITEADAYDLYGEAI